MSTPIYTPVLGSWAGIHWRGATVQDTDTTCPKCGAPATLQEPVRSWTRDGGWVEQRSVRCRGTATREVPNPGRGGHQYGFGKTMKIRGCGLVMVEERAVEGAPPAVGQQQQEQERKEEETTMGKPSATAHSERMKEVWRQKRARQAEEMERQRQSHKAAAEVGPATTERPSPVVEVEEPVPAPEAPDQAPARICAICQVDPVEDGKDECNFCLTIGSAPALTPAPPPPTFDRCQRCGVNVLLGLDTCMPCTREIDDSWQGVASPDPTEREPEPAPAVAEEPAPEASSSREISFHFFRDSAPNLDGLASLGFRRRTVADKMRAAADQLGSITLREARGLDTHITRSIEIILAFVEASDAEGTEGAQVNQEAGLPT